MTTLEAAEAFGRFTEREAQAFLRRHGADTNPDISAERAKSELCSDWLDAVELCLWLGY